MQDEFRVLLSKTYDFPAVITDVLGIKKVIWDNYRNYVTGTSGPHYYARKWDENVEKEVFKDGSWCYRQNGAFHCPFEPALLSIDGTPLWYIEGALVSDMDLNIVKKVLEDIKLAPLYLNQPIVKHTAKWVLKHYQKNNYE